MSNFVQILWRTLGRESSVLLVRGMCKTLRIIQFFPLNKPTHNSHNKSIVFLPSGCI